MNINLLAFLPPGGTSAIDGDCRLSIEYTQFGDSRFRGGVS